MNKSYKQFSLTTLQLPAPSTNLTKAEYKDKYGIDLDSVNIPSFKLVVYENDKFPIDQIKTVEGGYEIYFNGRILSITDIVQTSDGVYDVANSKPIYCHPILLYYTTSAGSGVVQCRVNFLIFNNVEDAYTRTNVIAMIKNLLDSGAIIQCSGFYVEDSKSKPTILMVKKTASPIYSLLINNLDGTESYKDIENLGYLYDVSDGVNKIN